MADHWYLLGALMVPLLLTLGVPASGEISDHGHLGQIPESISVAAHILAYATGCFLAAMVFTVRRPTRPARFATRLLPNPARTAWVLVVISIVSNALVVWSIGLQDLLLTSLQYRASGDAELAGSAPLFLRSLGNLSIVSAAIAISVADRVGKLVWVCAAAVLLTFAIGLSRNAIFYGLLLPLMFRLLLGEISAFKLALMSVSAAVLVVGAAISRAWIAGTLQGGADTVAGSGLGSIGELFVSMYGYQYASVWNGIDHFSVHGPSLMPIIEFAQGLVGFMPSALLGAMGLSALDYRGMADTLQCTNSVPFGAYCSVPPYSLGISAYVFPVIGGALVGFARFYGQAWILESGNQAPSQKSGQAFATLGSIWLSMVFVGLAGSIGYVVFTIVLVWLVSKWK